MLVGGKGFVLGVRAGGGGGMTVYEIIDRASRFIAAAKVKADEAAIDTLARAMTVVDAAREFVDCDFMDTSEQSASELLPRK